RVFLFKKFTSNISKIIYNLNIAQALYKANPKYNEVKADEYSKSAWDSKKDSQNHFYDKL
ncbi:MAG: hypothetical protein VX541_12075, partial [Candidatus Poribacteria bacterium]|nr:hypothetical protein [Candidatus Poribacteria bacterium]